MLGESTAENPISNDISCKSCPENQHDAIISLSLSLSLCLLIPLPLSLCLSRSLFQSLSLSLSIYLSIYLSPSLIEICKYLENVGCIHIFLDEYLQM